MTPDDGLAIAAPEASAADHGKQNAFRSHIARIAKRIAASDFGTGPLAELRRKDPQAVSAAPSFHRLTAHMDDVSWAGDAPVRWAAMIQAMATGTRPGEGAPAESAGKALAESGYSESRFARLLASRGETFRSQILLLARYMNGKQARFDWRDLGELVLVEGLREKRAETLRFRIARDYYRALDKRQRDAAA